MEKTRRAEQFGRKVNLSPHRDKMVDGKVRGGPGGHRRLRRRDVPTTSPRPPHILDGRDIGSGYFSLSRLSHHPCP
ncbi:MAG: hypothetical protein ACLT9P_07510 [Evtepia gabavorous]